MFKTWVGPSSYHKNVGVSFVIHSPFCLADRKSVV